MHTRVLTFIAVPVLALGLAACGSSSKPSSSSSSTSAPAASASASDSGTITIDASFNFSAATVKAGSTVTVKNNSGSQHTVSADDSSAGFNVTIDAGKTATFTAPATAGTYKFHCNIHNFMHGTLTVS
jgi:plastocyanin